MRSLAQMRQTYTGITGKLVLAVVLVLAAVLVCSCNCPLCSKDVCGKADKIKVVVVTGGHDFEHDPFFEVFKACDDIEFTEAAQKDHSELFEDISSWNYDVIVLYNMTQNISPKRRENFVKLLNKGVGLVAMHHCMADWPDWEQYREIIGTKYCLQEVTIDGRKHAASSYKHDLDMKIQIADTRHPITKGLKDFEIHDEAYKDCWFAKDNHLLLTTDHPMSDKTVGWTRMFGKACVCTIQLGHDSKAYANPAFRRLVANSIRWCAGKLK